VLFGFPVLLPVIVRLVVTQEPPRFALTIAVCNVLNFLSAVAVKVAVVLPDPTIVEPGTISQELSSEIDNAVPPEGAGSESTTVQVLELPAEIELGEHASEDTVVAALRDREAVCDEVPSVAVTVAVWLEVMVPAVAVKVALLTPAATVTEAGVVSEALLSEIVSAVPPAGAALEIVTTHVADAAE
jgi:hypothetical protein